MESLDISNNPLCNAEDYTAKVRELLPNIDVLDGFNKEGAEVVSEDESEEGDEDEEEGEEDDEEGEGEEDGEDEEGEDGEDDEDDEEEEEGDEAEEGAEGENPDDDANPAVGKKRKSNGTKGIVEANGESVEGLDVAKKRVNIDNQWVIK